MSLKKGLLLGATGFIGLLMVNFALLGLFAPPVPDAGKVAEQPQQRIVLVTHWYRDPNDTRREELMQAVASNAQNPLIHGLHLLHDPEEQVQRARLLLASQFHLGPSELRKLVFQSQGTPGRLMVSTALEYASRQFSDMDVVIFANTDITFDSSLRFLLGDDNLINIPRHLYALSRYEFHPSPRRPSMCSRHYRGSHDSFVFVPPLPPTLPSQLEGIHIGAAGYENRLMYEFQQAGYMIKNPCLSIKSFHHHDSGAKADKRIVRVNTKNRSVSMRPAFHQADPGDFLQNSVQYLDFDTIWAVLRGKFPAEDLCEVPPALLTLVSHFCQPGQAYRDIFPWNCTHLPCSVLTPQEPAVVECTNRMNMYRCHRHTTLTALLERGDLTVYFEGRFSVSPPFFDELERWRRIPHPWLFGFVGESVFNYPGAANPDILRHFNWTIGYDRSLYDERISQYLVGKEDLYTRPPRPRIGHQKASVMMMISNCRDKNNRLAYARELMNYIAVDSFGKCLHNKNITDVLPNAEQLDPMVQKAQLMARYHFVISFENSNLPDYITEKLWEPLKCGTVPIYYGAPNVDQYLPGPKAIIKAEKYHPRKLAEYLQTLIDNETLYNEYFEWKNAPSEAFKNILAQNNQFFPVQCGVCQRVWDFYS